jgi:hypothetical protein
LFDLAKASQALGFELGRAQDPVLHEPRITGYGHLTNSDFDKAAAQFCPAEQKAVSA